MANEYGVYEKEERLRDKSGECRDRKAQSFAVERVDDSRSIRLDVEPQHHHRSAQRPAPWQPCSHCSSVRVAPGVPVTTAQARNQRERSISKTIPGSTRLMYGPQSNLMIAASGRP